MPDCDVLIVGGGPVGAALALALRGTGLEVRQIEARAPEAVKSDPRPIALSHGSRLILERLGVWDALAPATPIARIHVSQRGGFGRVELDAQEACLPALGYVVDYGRLAATLARALEAPGGGSRIQATVSAFETSENEAHACFDSDRGPARIAARLIAVADGGALTPERIHTRDYHQSVVTARVASLLPHRNVAYERFTPGGPLALLPMGDQLALVWTTTPEHARQLCESTNAEFLEQLQTAFGGRLGAFRDPGARSQYPLVLKAAEHVAERHLVRLGNAAQTLHPVAGQGFNLGLRDAWELATTTRDPVRAEIGGVSHLRSYEARRWFDRRGGMLFTDALVRLFSNDIAPLRLARGLGLAALGIAPPLKDFVVRRMTFGARG